MDEEERRFLATLAGFNQELKRKEISQEEILQNDEHGVFLTFGGITLNYNLPEFDQNKKEYLVYQAEKHRIFLDVLQNHRLEKKKELWRLNSKIYAIFTNPSRPELGKEIEKTSLNVSFDEMYKEGALIGKYFFEARLAEGITTELKPMLEGLVDLINSIYENAKALEAADNEKLQYFRNKQSVGYAKKS